MSHKKMNCWFAAWGIMKMAYLVQFQINIFALGVLFALYLFVRASKLRTFSGNIILWIIYATGASIILEPLTWIFDGMMFPGAYFLEYSTNFLLFLVGPVIGGVLLSYVDYRIFKDQRRIRSKMYYQQASVLTFFILLYNLYNPIYFRINPLTNGFNSGPFKELHYVVLAAFYVYMVFFAWKHRQKIPVQETLIFVLCFLSPIAGMVIQMFDSKLHFSWTSIVLGLLLVYVFLETVPSEEDHLTKLFNRRSYETELSHLLKSGKEFGVFIFDLNNFKEINDEHGHQKGDEVIVAFGRALEKIFSEKGLASRLGGDEFAVILRGGDKKVERYIHQLSTLLHQEKDPVVASLTFSYGYQHYHQDMTMDDLYTLADGKMYLHKKASKEIQLS